MALATSGILENSKGKGRIFSVLGSSSLQKHCHLLKEYNPLLSSRKIEDIKLNMEKKTQEEMEENLSRTELIHKGKVKIRQEGTGSLGLGNSLCSLWY